VRPRLFFVYFSPFFSVYSQRIREIWDEMALFTKKLLSLRDLRRLQQIIENFYGKANQKNHHA
jgi:hypothetical protein